VPSHGLLALHPRRRAHADPASGAPRPCLAHEPNAHPPRAAQQALDSDRGPWSRARRGHRTSHRSGAGTCRATGRGEPRRRRPARRAGAGDGDDEPACRPPRQPHVADAKVLVRALSRGWAPDNRDFVRGGFDADPHISQTGGYLPSLTCEVFRVAARAGGRGPTRPDEPPRLELPRLYVDEGSVRTVVAQWLPSRWASAGLPIPREPAHTRPKARAAPG
jgi:hypothetical protein